ncbi:MAG: BPSS1780 family membrane protein [Thiolinea sp.]
MVQIKSVPAGNALDWFKCGWKVFSADMVNWVLMALIFFIIVVVLGFIPVLGVIAVYLLLPLLQAGMLKAAQESRGGGAINFSDLFAAFKMDDKRSPLLALGGIMLAAVFAVMMFSVPFIGGSVMSSMDEAQSSGMPMLPTLGVGGMLFAVTAGLALAMMFFYAPALVMLRGLGAVDAIKASFSGAWKNLLPFVIFMLIYAVLSIIAGIPFGLGFLVLLPVVIAANYCSYKDIFA